MPGDDLGCEETTYNARRKLGDEEILSDALQSHHTQPTRTVEAGSDPLQVLVSKKLERTKLIEIFMFEARS